HRTCSLTLATSHHFLVELGYQVAEPVHIEFFDGPNPQLSIGEDIARPDAGVERAQAPSDAIQVGHAASRLLVVVVPENGRVFVVHVPDSSNVLSEVLLPLGIPPPNVHRAARLPHALEA